MEKTKKWPGNKAIGHGITLGIAVASSIGDVQLELHIGCGYYREVWLQCASNKFHCTSLGSIQWCTPVCLPIVRERAYVCMYVED